MVGGEPLIFFTKNIKCEQYQKTKQVGKITFSVYLNLLICEIDKSLMDNRSDPSWFLRKANFETEEIRHFILEK